MPILHSHPDACHLLTIKTPIKLLHNIWLTHIRAFYDMKTYVRDFPVCLATAQKSVQTTSQKVLQHQIEVYNTMNRTPLALNVIPCGVQGVSEDL